MAAQSSEPAISQEVFLTVIADSSTPAWDELFNKYLRTLLVTVFQMSNAAKIPKQPRISYVLYSSATPYASPIVKDMYFTRNQDTFNAMKTISVPLQGSIARNLPDGGSAALEGLVRAVEHFDLMEELEPHSLNSPKHVFFITSSPPDASQRPLWNNCEKFDNFGWKQCEEWLQQRSVALTLVATRLPPHAIYTSLYTNLNPGPVDPIPPTGPVRVFISRGLREKMRGPPNYTPTPAITNASSLTHSSPAVATSSPAANAASPNTSRKRKATDDGQESPRRAKFPSGTMGNPPAISTPPSGPVGIPIVPLPPNGSPLRSGSVTGMRTIVGMGGTQVKMEPQPTVIPNQAAVNVSASMPGTAQPGRDGQQMLRHPNTGTTQPQSGSQALFPPQITNPHSSQANPLAGSDNNNNSSRPMSGLSAATYSQIQQFLSTSPESQKERLLKLKEMLDDHHRAILQLESENRHPEAKERMAQREKVREFIVVLLQAQQAQKARFVQGISQPNQAISAPTAATIPTAPAQNPGGAMAGPSRQPFQSANVNNISEGSQAAGNINMSTGDNNAFVNGSQTAQIATAPQNQFLWRGTLSITGQDGRRATPELLVSLSSMKASPQQKEALTAWPPKIFMTPIRQHTPPDKLVNWLGQNNPDGLFNVRAIQLEHWQPSQRTNESTIMIQEGIKKFTMVQTAIITNKLVLHANISLTTGGTVTLILIHTPTGNNGMGLSEPQIAIARYTSSPNLSTLPGMPLPSPATAVHGPAPGTWGVNLPATMANTQSSTLPASMANPTPPNTFNNASIGGGNPAVNRGTMMGGMMTGNALGNQMGSTAGAATPTNPQQLVNLLMSIGATNLVNSLGGANNVDVNALMKNPQFIAKLAQFKGQYQQQQQMQQQVQQQQQIGLGMSTSGVMGNSGNSGANIMGLANGGMSGATLLDRLNVLGRNSVSGTGPAGNNNFGGPNTASALRNQFLNTFTAHSSAIGAINANKGVAANNANSAAMFNQPNTLGYGLGGGINMAGGSNGAHGLNMNAATSGPNSMAGGGGMLGNTIDPDLIRRASSFASQMGISQQDALKALVNLSMGIQQQGGWNGGAPGSGG